MRLKSSVKYQVWDYGKAMAAYYVILVMVLVTWLRMAGQNGSGGRWFFGIEAFTVLFSFIVGLYAFKDCFTFFMQNGISRKIMFSGRCVAVVSMGFVSALAGQLLVSVCRLVNSHIMFGVYRRLYHAQIPQIGLFRGFIGELVFNFSIYVLSGCIGYFMAVMYYRMSRFWKFGVSIAIPSLILWSLPYLDQMVRKERLSIMPVSPATEQLGTGIIVNYGLLLICAFLSVLIALLSWYFLRKTAVRS